MTRIKFPQRILERAAAAYECAYDASENEATAEVAYDAVLDAEAKRMLETGDGRSGGV